MSSEHSSLEGLVHSRRSSVGDEAEIAGVGMVLQKDGDNAVVVTQLVPGLHTYEYYYRIPF